MHKLIMPLAASVAAAITFLAKAEDINVPVGDTVTISSTPAEQPSVANVHGTLEVKGGATVYPATLNVGCAAGDSAKVTVSGSGTRLGCGRSGQSAPACAVTLGANGGSGMMVVDGGDTGVEWGGLGLYSMTIDAAAVSTGDTIDFLTLRSGYARTSGMVNNNAKPARILFSGGGLRCGQGWGTKLTAAGDFIWESVNRSTILVDLSNYGNAVTIGDAGTLTVRGEGTVHLRCAWGDGTFNNGQVTVSKAIRWEGSNSLNIGENLKLNLKSADSLPYGAGKGGVTINNGNAYINSPDGVSQHVNSLYVKSGKYTGTGKIIFGAEDVDGELSGKIHEASAIDKVGAGTLTITGATTATNSTLNVLSGKVLVKNDLSVRKFAIADGANIEVDGAVLTIYEDSACAKVDCRNGGRVVLATSNAAESSLLRHDVGGETELLKTGLGKLMVYDPTALPSEDLGQGGRGGVLQVRLHQHVLQVDHPCDHPSEQYDEDRRAGRLRRQERVGGVEQSGRREFDRCHAKGTVLYPGQSELRLVQPRVPVCAGSCAVYRWPQRSRRVRRRGTGRSRFLDLARDRLAPAGRRERDVGFRRLRGVA